MIKKELLPSLIYSILVMLILMGYFPFVEVVGVGNLIYCSIFILVFLWLLNRIITNNLGGGVERAIIIFCLLFVPVLKQSIRENCIKEYPTLPGEKWGAYASNHFLTVYPLSVGLVSLVFETHLDCGERQFHTVTFLGGKAFAKFFASRMFMISCLSMIAAVNVIVLTARIIRKN